MLNVIDFSSLGDEKVVTMLINTMIRIVAGLFFITVLSSLGYQTLFSTKNFWKSLIIMIPAFMISINNFPIIAYFDQRAYFTESPYHLLLFFIECLSIGFFEEIIFRGVILIYLIKKLSHLQHGILISIMISSLVFGVFHLINIFDGASIGNTLLQVGYSFLVSMLWAMLYVKTGHLWLTMLLHATYNFFGQVVFYLGVVHGRYDLLTIISTFLLSIIVMIYAIKIYKHGNFQIKLTL